MNILTSPFRPIKLLRGFRGLMVRKRKFIVCIATSADGFIARRDGSVDWLASPRLKGDHGMGVFYRAIDTCVKGRKTYEHAVKFGMADGDYGLPKFRMGRSGFGRGYSCRSASVGWTPAALRAGTQLAPSATKSKTRAAAERVTGSDAVMPKSIERMKRASKSDNITPITIPTIDIREASLRIISRICLGIAPKARRTPISLVRCTTV